MIKKIDSKKGILFFITGLSGSGKSTISKKIKNKIEKLYGPTIIISGEKIRNILRFYGYSKKERAEVGKKNINTGYYTVFVDNESYQAHRIVYYLRTKESPDRHGVQHNFSNRNKDNRLELKPSYFTNVRY